MEFSEDFAKRLKEKLPEKFHVAIDEGSYVEIANFLGGFSRLSFSPEDIIKACKEGRVEQDILETSVIALKMAELYKELEAEWDRQSCSFRTAKSSV